MLIAMLLAIEKDKAKDILKDYYKQLSAMGYTKRPVVGRFVFWLFILYFVERVYTLFTEKDYNLINKALIKLFSSGDCLFSYKLIKSKKVTVGRPIYMGSFRIRTTEDNSWRGTEAQRIRGVEGE